MKAYTDITLLVDRSGSMSLIKNSMESALSNFISEHRAVKSTRVTLIEFDSINNQDVQFVDTPVGSVEKITILPRGNTPLLDALSIAIDRTGQRLAAKPESERPDQVLMIVITDGQENDSKQHSRQDVFNRISKQTNNYNWQFVYLGANQDAFAEAGNLGFTHGNILNYLSQPQSVRTASASLASNTLGYTLTKGEARGRSVKSFTDEQREDTLDKK